MDSDAPSQFEDLITIQSAHIIFKSKEKFELLKHLYFSDVGNVAIFKNISN
jgi:hypothetical protein